MKIELGRWMQQIPAMGRVALQVIQGRAFSGTAVRSVPCRYYIDTNDAVRDILTQKKLDKYAFATWQDLINYCAKNGDKPSVYAAYHLAKFDSEPVVIPPIQKEAYVQGIYRLVDIPISPIELDHFERLHQSALKCLDKKQIDFDFFKSYDQLADYFLDIDQSDKAQQAYSLKVNHTYRSY